MRSVLVLVTSLLLFPVVGVPGAASALEPAATTTTLTATRDHAGNLTTLTATVLDEAGEPVPGRAVTITRRRSGEWDPVAEGVTGADGTVVATARISRQPRDNVFRARHLGDATYAASASPHVEAGLVRRRSRVTLTGPDQVVDEERVRLRIAWVARTSGEAVRGPVRLQQRRNGRWRTIRRARTNRQGVARVTLRPRRDVRLRVRATRLTWVRGDTSPVHRIDNLPPAAPVRLPRRAPRPRVNLPDQRRAQGDGVNAVVTRIPDGVWRQMVGRTWHRGCPVGRSGLRLLRANYYDYAGYRRRGELVVNAGATGKFVAALRDIYAAELPLRSMYRVDRFGWSDRLHGGNDYRSMAAGNTSAFNCRDVVGRPGVQSPHSWGRAFDLNTWENPYHSSGGWTPNRWWAARSHPRVAWRSGEHQMVEIMRRNGFAWTYGTEDSQHFDARSSGRVLARCATVCH